MERYKRQLEAYAGDYKGKGYYQHDALFAGDGEINVLEIQRTRKSVYIRQAQKEDCRREHRCKDVLHGGLMALVMFLVKGYHCSQRERGRLKADDKQKEVACRNHKVHAEQGHQ
jgi:hypothetical protein